MGLWKSVFARKPKISHAQVVQRAVAVIDHVIFDVGIDTLVGGTFVLDETLRLRFIGLPAPPARGVIASVQVSAIAEATPFREFGMAGRHDVAAVRAHSATLAHAVVRELGMQAPALRALPLAEA